MAKHKVEEPKVEVKAEPKPIYVLGWQDKEFTDRKELAAYFNFIEKENKTVTVIHVEKTTTGPYKTIFKVS